MTDTPPPPTPEPTPPTGSPYAPPSQPPTPYQAPPAPPAPPGGPSYGSQTYAAPARTGRGRRWGRLGGLLAVVAVIGVKILAALGIGGLFHHVEHRAGDAEKSVDAVLQASTAAEAMPHFVAGVRLNRVLAGCSELTDESSVTYKISRSSLEDDGSADVTVDVVGKDGDVHFHLVDQGGWKIDDVTCD